MKVFVSEEAVGEWQLYAPGPRIIMKTSPLLHEQFLSNHQFILSPERKCKF